jgi:prophage tail gpP-like protein
MSKPTQGSWYTVTYGDTIRKISRLAYGRDLSSFIVNANYDTLKDRELSLEGIPLIFSGDKLFLPVYKNRYNNETITADFDTQIEVRLNGVRLPGVKTGRIGRQMNQIASGFIFEVPFDPYNRDQVDLLRPFTWHPAQLYIGGELYITALAAKWDYSESDAGTVAKIECRTMPGEMLECMGMRKSLVFKKGMTLLDICREVAAPYGITCYSSSGSGGVVTQTAVGDAFGRVEQDATQPDGEFLQDLARQKGFLITSLPDGNLLLCRANTEDKPSCSLIQGVYPLLSVASSFDGSKRYSKWIGLTEEFGVSGVSVTLNDTTVTRPRGFAFKASESEEGNIETATKWRMAKSFAESISIPVRVAGWRNANGELWAENMKLTLQAPGAFLFKETEYITESVELTKDENGGDVAEMHLVLPESYTLTMPKDPFPWSGYPKPQPVAGPSKAPGQLEIE